MKLLIQVTEQLSDSTAFETISQLSITQVERPELGNKGEDSVKIKDTTKHPDHIDNFNILLGKRRKQDRSELPANKRLHTDYPNRSVVKNSENSMICIEIVENDNMSRIQNEVSESQGLQLDEDYEESSIYYDYEQLSEFQYAKKYIRESFFK